MLYLSRRHQLSVELRRTLERCTRLDEDLEIANSTVRSLEKAARDEAELFRLKWQLEQAETDRDKLREELRRTAESQHALLRRIS